ncbi:uncharacterized protein SPPG_00631 [Spizellomyces punctatus DAOM BR117]|uniref:Cyclin-dependent kinases regulatory subunit n=1 Tax=Spizellomyces punctatus (strain DAOM BR117) TaxID=645134 RepID=A0A0L0HUA7_SPIPD|nr:uncharacterized protein SPPG_00631 [Spizellomyces punctatus DAOM BR117]KND04941.1 hypothetical protein SPPG_00631 [Spizellomyces punctatus DAOM BR117]|eukprot:XP_016612980.1 hypothetical protein SPPG_00631 [Spizellomyces punctatus DAOM BR117]
MIGRNTNTRGIAAARPLAVPGGRYQMSRPQGGNPGGAANMPHAKAQKSDCRDEQDDDYYDGDDREQSSGVDEKDNAMNAEKENLPPRPTRHVASQHKTDLLPPLPQLKRHTTLPAPAPQHKNQSELLPPVPQLRKHTTRAAPVPQPKKQSSLPSLPQQKKQKTAAQQKPVANPVSNFVLPKLVLPDTPRAEELIEQIHYSARYYCDTFEYRHVILPKALYEMVPATHKRRLLSENEWRAIGIQQSVGWVHYMLHNPEPHIFAFRREKYYQEKLQGQHQPSQATQEDVHANGSTAKEEGEEDSWDEDEEELGESDVEEEEEYEREDIDEQQLCITDTTSDEEVDQRGEINGGKLYLSDSDLPTSEVDEGKQCLSDPDSPPPEAMAEQRMEETSTVSLQDGVRRSTRLGGSRQAQTSQSGRQPSQSWEPQSGAQPTATLRQHGRVEAATVDLPRPPAERRSSRRA